MQYGYGRISRKSQKIERQIENISRAYPDAKIYTEAYTGTKVEGRAVFNWILSVVQKDDDIIFDSVSRMARNKDEGVELYFRLFDMGVNLIFLKETQINTSVYREAIQQSIPETGNEIADIYIDATNKVIRLLAKKQIEKAFEQAQKEVDDLHERTREGIREARRRGKQVGRAAESTIETKKAAAAKVVIKKHNKAFGGSLNNDDTMKLAGISKVTFYKYKKELLNET